MTQLILSLIEIAALVAVLAVYLTVIGNQLKRISATLAKITYGVRAVETMCSVIGPAVDRINGNLQDICMNLQEAAVEAEKLSR
jgi:t-SNARE complex subunit (syntaxin)